MSAAKHTPGPWTVHVEPVLSKALAALELSKLVDGTKEFSGVLPMVVGANGLCTAITGCGPDGLVNADLIAAATELLEVVRGFIEEKVDYMRINNLGDPEATHMVKWGRAVMAAATGSAS